MNKNSRLCLLVFLLFLLGCGADVATTGDIAQSNSNSEAKPLEDGVRIRIVNRSAVEMNNVVIHFPDQAERYSRIAPGETTEYRQLTKAYRYAPLEVSINGEVKKLLVIDYVGEELLPTGNYTYALTFDPNQSSGNGLDFRLEQSS